ncbi:MAG: leucyl aminopeptidase family protein [Alphaproteobacteria bacterium]|nr:leucyl aminopeptidase family protein [Alphaproteobacteria bacterium]
MTDETAPAVLVESEAGALPLTIVTRESLVPTLGTLDPAVTRWVEATRFTAETGTHLLVPDGGGKPLRVLAAASGPDAIWDLAGLPEALPDGTYALDAAGDDECATSRALGWALGAYAFTHYRARKHPPANLVWPRHADRKLVARLARAQCWTRDLINTPAEAMGPAELQQAAEALAAKHGARCTAVVGDDLLAANYPTIHAVGRASSRPPRIVDLTWGDVRAPKLTLVGKGVCFDSGGLDLKTSSGMRWMKKDMGGAATLLALGDAIMDAGLDVRLRILVPAVDNAVSGGALRPGDIVRTRQGMTVEIGNTDAEGRLILCDALAEATSERPELIVDMATLTGAARVALGPDLPALFVRDDALAASLLAAGTHESDPLWRLPLWQPYCEMLKTPIADINNVSDGPFAGAITAALFLAEFVPTEIPWMHLDTYAWNGKTRPGRPEGGEALALRALYAFAVARYGDTR